MRKEVPNRRKDIFEKPKVVGVDGVEITEKKLTDEDLEIVSGGVSLEQTCNYGGG